MVHPSRFAVGLCASLLCAFGCYGTEGDGGGQTTVGSDTDPGGQPDGALPPDTDATSPPTQTKKVDLLWVIDNSSSMCGVQEKLRDGFDDFVDELDQSGADFQIGVTTTHFQENSAFETVAKPGRLQSTPHPSTSFAPSCQFARDASGEPKDPQHPDGPDFSSVRDQIEAAIACTKNPSEFEDLKSWTTDHFRCALLGEESACQAVGERRQDFSIERLFPCGDKMGKRCTRSELESVYRDIPKVLKSSDYTDSNGNLEVDRLKRDWACMSFVGTRGSTIERGLQAAAKAVSPEMTGGTVEDPSDASAPNHGLLRKDAKTGVVFVSDEDDCSHQGDVIQENSTQNGCGELNCYLATEGGEQPPLISVDELAADFRDNLAQSKGVSDVPADDLFVASVHGTPKQYVAKRPETCTSTQQSQLRSDLVVCGSSTTTAKSGGRYAEFIGGFTHAYPGDGETGLICEDTFLPVAIAQEIGALIE